MSATSRLPVLLALLLLAGWSVSCTCCEDEWAASVPVSTSTQSAVAGAQSGDADDDDDADQDDAGEDDDEEQAIALDQVPADVLAAASAAVPGAVFTSAELEKEHGHFVYCLEGHVDGEAVEVEVAPDGRVLEIEHGDD